MRGRGGRFVGGVRAGRRADSAAAAAEAPRFQYSAQYVPFDLATYEEAFPRVSPATDDRLLTEALLHRNEELTPTIQQQTNIQSLVTSVCTIVESLILTPGSFESAQIEEVRPVGSFKIGTMMVSSNVADVVIILRTLPTKEAVNALGNRLASDLKGKHLVEVPVLMMLGDGFEIVSGDSVVRCLIGTIPANLGKLMPGVHMSPIVMENNLAAIRHARWFEENASHTSVKVMVRLLKDLRNRVDGFKALNPWMIVVLAHHAATNFTRGQTLPINMALRRCLQLLAAGLFLPGSVGLPILCDASCRNCHHNVAWPALDRLCCAAQTLLRVLCYGGHRQLLDTEGASGVATETSIWNGVVMLPSEPVCATSGAEVPADQCS